jgi:23S rRNA (uridine2552-2'-O)-methyltransferase
MVGDRGHLVGVDLANMELSFPNLDFYQMDIFEFDPQTILDQHGLIDVVISDVAPKTTGNQLVDHERSFQLSLKALNLARALLKTNKGSFVCKMYQGESFERYKKLLEQHFSDVHIYRPKATRKISREIFWVAKGRQNESDSA